uniref:methyltransferase domain-containing protein n=1 Tax=Pseudomonas mosselii TaxID=78327 RepID=UPI0035CD32AC
MPSFYRAFEDRYRGSRELIKERLQVYRGFIAPLQSLYSECAALDLGCGRGEWLELLQEQGFRSLGVDLDEGMLEVCDALGLPTERCDVLEKLKALPDESQVMVSGFHIAEHLPFASLQVLVAEALRVLKPAGLLILETPNAENIVVGTNNFYLDPTHERPIPHLLLGFLTEYSGFARSKLLRLQEAAGLDAAKDISLSTVLGGVSPDYAIVAQKQGEAAQLGLFDEVFSVSYGVGLGTLAERYEHRQGSRFTDLEGKVDKTIALCSSLSQYIIRLQGKSAVLMDTASHAISPAEGASAATSAALQSISSHLSMDVDALQGEALAHHLRLQLQETLNSLRHAEVRYQNSELALHDQLARAAKAEGLQAKSQASAEVYQVQLQQVTAELLTAFKEQQRLQLDVEALRHQQVSSTQMLELERARGDTLLQRVSEQESLAEALAGERDALMRERESLEAELQGALDGVAQAERAELQRQAEILRFQDELHQCNLHVADLESRLAGGEQRTEMTASQLKELVQHSAQLESELRRSQASLLTSLAAAEQLSLQANAHQERIQALLGSTSWRISSPLRGVSLAVRWLLRLPVRLLKAMFRPLVTGMISFALARPGLRQVVSRQLRRLPRLHAHLRAFAISRAFQLDVRAESSIAGAVDGIGVAEQAVQPVVAAGSGLDVQQGLQNVQVRREESDIDFHAASNTRLMDSFALKTGGAGSSGLARAYRKTIDDSSEN